MASTLARMTRAARGTIGIEIAMHALMSEGPRAAARTRANTRIGSACMMSITRWASRSVLPPT
jgi:hypothetical protein